MASEAQFDAYRQRFDGGDAFALIEALAYAAKEEVLMPQWLCFEVRRRIELVFDQPVSLHQAFGLEGVLPSGPGDRKRGATSRRRMREAEALGALVTAIEGFEGLSRHAAVCKALRVHRFPFGVTVATALVKEWEQVQRVHLPPRRRKETLLKASRKPSRKRV